MSGDELLEEAKKYSQNLLNFFWRQGVSPCDGEDLLQETFLRLWKYRDRYVKSAKLSTFLFVIARQVRLDALRGATRRAKREEDFVADSPDRAMPPSPCVREDVRWALSQLSEPMREVVELGVFQDLPYAEIAQVMGIPVGTVKSRMSNALVKLKELFNERRS
jgi:RNA polymerase sigma-70 factor (ECF subfamily)